MTQVIHGLTREQLVAQVFQYSKVCCALTTIIAKSAEKAERDSRSDNGGKSKKDTSHD